MKRDWDNLNLRPAFRDEPDDCHAALMNAARSVKEEEKMKKVSFRVALIAALIILSLTAVGLAAGRVAGWNEFYNGYHTLTDAVLPETIPGDAPVVLVTKKKSFEKSPRLSCKTP